LEEHMGEAAMEDREEREKETAEIRVPLVLLFIPRSGIPIESWRRRAVSRPAS
jgi:hypothetical protein